MRYILDLKNKTYQKAIERNELPQTQDIDVHKLVEVYERDQDVRFPVKGRARTKPWIKWVNTALTLAVIHDVNKYCAT